MCLHIPNDEQPDHSSVESTAPSEQLSSQSPNQLPSGLGTIWTRFLEHQTRGRFVLGCARSVLSSTGATIAATAVVAAEAEAEASTGSLSWQARQHPIASSSCCRAPLSIINQYWGSCFWCGVMSFGRLEGVPCWVSNDPPAGPSPPFIRC